MNSKTIAIIGIGANGTAVLKELSKENFDLILIDRDIIEEHNIKNQLIYSKEDIGKPKAIAAKEKFSDKKIEYYCEDLTFENINILDKADLIIDCTDNLETRFLINDYCLKNKKPWIYSAAIKNKATTINFFPDSVCFRCIFKAASGLETCEVAGINVETTKKLAKIVVENTKKILNKKDVETNMIRINLDNDSEELIKLQKKNCIACKGTYDYLNGKVSTKATKLCGSQTYQIKGDFKIDEDFKIINKEITLFKDGRAIIKAKNETEAKVKYSKFVGN